MSASRNARRTVAALAASVALLGAAALPASAEDHHDRGAGRSAVVIGKVQYDAPGREDRSNRSLNGEWVEVKNTGRKAVELRGFTLTDQQGNRYRFEHLRLDGRSSVQVHTGRGKDSSRDVYQDSRHHIWDSRDTATLRDARGHVIDTRSWGKRGR
ncbi:lamin tail domain-containing protein [Streptomyces sp. NPDC101733]|uniref:lamin tail domain-containing protein n=1 Tax=unclassified Streptomyces TaxID=2593676 RepID=UPI00382BDF42